MINSEQAPPEPGHADRSATRQSDGAPRASRLRAAAVAALVAGAAAGALALYGMNHPSGNAPPQETASAPSTAACAAAAVRAPALATFARDGLAALKVPAVPQMVPNLSFTDADGQPRTLADFRGRVLLVNLWATWCAPCRKEMPDIDRLAGMFAGREFAVLAINLDNRDPEKPRAFLREIGTRHIDIYSDPQGRSFQALRAVGRGFGLPTTLLVDRDGCELAVLAGPANWGGADAVALVEAALGPPQ